MGAMKEYIQSIVDAGGIICRYCGDLDDGPWINDVDNMYICETCYDNSRLRPVLRQESLFDDENK